jgi:Tol biopolymer transport system component/DNA-binding winged helix-turn-helix (wHTH) protein
LQDSDHIFEFGPFQLRAGEGVLCRSGEIVPLTPKAYSTLLVLVAQSGRVLDKEHLLKEVWPDSFVEEGNLSQNIFLLRRALGGMPDGRQYIETVPKRGYRFAAPVAEIREPLGGSVSTTPLLRTRAPRRLPLRIAVAAAAVLAVTLAIASRVLFHQQPSDVRITRLNVDNNPVYGIISPDGKSLAYVSGEPSGQSLWVRQVDAFGTGTRISGAVLGHHWGVAYAPDGEHLYYVLDEHRGPDAGSLYRVSVRGGTPERLLAGINSAPAFRPDGRYMVFKRYERETGRALLVKATAEGTGLQVIAASQAPYPYYGPQWAPDGNTILYAYGSHEAQGTAWTLAEIPPDGGPEKQLSRQPQIRSLRSLGWIDRQNLVAVMRTEKSGPLQLWRLSTNGEPHRLTNDTSSYSEISLTADGATLLGSHLETLDSLWIAGFSAGGTVQAASIDLGVSSYDSPVWTPDGRVLYIYNPDYVKSELWLADLAAPRRRPLPGFPSDIAQPACSSDGRVVVFVSETNGSRNIWRAGLEGGGATRLTAGALDFYPQLSPDGKWVIYASKVNGRWGVWKTSMDSRVPPVKLADSPETAPAISPDGTLVAHEQIDPANNQVELAIRSLEDGKLRQVLPLRDGADNIRWRRDGHALTFITHDGEFSQIWAQALSGGPPVPIVQELPYDLKQMEWSPDGKRIVYLRRRLKKDLVLVKNFR